MPKVGDFYKYLAHNWSHVHSSISINTVSKSNLKQSLLDIPISYKV